MFFCFSDTVIYFGLTYTAKLKFVVMQEMPSKLPGIREDIKYLNLETLELLQKKNSKLFFSL